MPYAVDLIGNFNDIHKNAPKEVALFQFTVDIDLKDMKHDMMQYAEKAARELIKQEFDLYSFEITQFKVKEGSVEIIIAIAAAGYAILRDYKNLRENVQLVYIDLRNLFKNIFKRPVKGDIIWVAPETRSDEILYMLKLIALLLLIIIAIISLIAQDTLQIDFQSLFDILKSIISSLA